MGRMQEWLLSGLREELGPALPAGAQSGRVLRNAHLKSQGLSSVIVQSLSRHRIPKMQGKAPEQEGGWPTELVHPLGITGNNRKIIFQSQRPCTPVISAFGRWRLEDQEPKAILSYFVS